MKPFAILLLATVVLVGMAFCAYAPDLSELRDDVQAYQTKSLLPE